MKSEMPKCKRCLYSSWIVKMGEEFYCQLGEGCEFKRKKNKFFEIEFNGEKLSVLQSLHYNLLAGELVNLFVYRNNDITNPRNEVLSAPNCRCFLNKTEVVGLLKATRSRVIK